MVESAWSLSQLGEQHFRIAGQPHPKCCINTYRMAWQLQEDPD